MDLLTVVIPELMPQSVVDAGLSPFRCGNCGNHVEKSSERFSSLWMEVPLLACKTCGDAQAGCITVSPSSAHLLQPTLVKDAIWYHATYVEDWFEKVSTGHGMKREAGDFLYIHVGNEDASRDLADSKYFTHPRDGEKIMLYRLKVKVDAVLAPSIFNDIETWWDYSSVTVETKNAIGGDVARYLNRWESPGSISLLIDARMLEMASVEELRDSKVLNSATRGS
jgi:hypothetical protein